MRVLVCGDRNWTNSRLIREYLEELNPDSLIEGEARGADRLSAIEASSMGIEVIRVPADWGEYGKAAGAIRNREMIKYEPELVIAFHNSIEESKGTADMLYVAECSGILYILVEE